MPGLFLAGLTAPGLVKATVQIRQIGLSAAGKITVF
jgi:hypothetical protein